jgi:hypothetical protein
VTTGKLHIPSSTTYSGSTENAYFYRIRFRELSPLYNQGTFTAPDTTTFSGTSSSDIEVTAYNALQIAPGSGSPTFSPRYGTTSISGNLTVGDGTNAVTLSTTITIR